MTVADRVREAFIEQAGWCTRLGSPFTALVCSTLAGRLDESTTIGERLLTWTSDPSGGGDALPLRVCGALHGLARSGRESQLAALFPPAPAPDPETLWHEVRSAFERHPAYFDTYLSNAPQTNEVGRSAVLVCGFLAIAKRVDLPLQLFEIGASAGLNLIPDRYRYRFGDVEWGDPQARLFLQPQWHGPAPPVDADLRVAGRSGCDIAPLDASSAEQRARLVSYVWPDQADRLMRLEAALETVRRDPPRLEQMDAAEWVEQRIPDSEAESGRVRVLYHSVVWRYLPEATQRRIKSHVERCAAGATREAPFAWLRFDLDDTQAGASLTLGLWPGGGETVLAHAQPHGSSIIHLASGL
jgi:hypothetical protein